MRSTRKEGCLLSEPAEKYLKDIDKIKTTMHTIAPVAACMWRGCRCWQKDDSCETDPNNHLKGKVLVRATMQEAKK